MDTEYARLQLRRGTLDQWTTSDPVLADGELGVVTDAGRFKVGDGSTAWSDLPYPEAGVYWRGTWSAETVYQVRDAVGHDGSSWLASTAPDVGDEPGVAGAWDVLAAAGADGADGEPGGVTSVDGQTGAVDLSGTYAETSSLSGVATSGSYDDLTDVPTVPLARAVYSGTVPTRPDATYVDWVGDVDPDTAADAGDTWTDTSE